MGGGDKKKQQLLQEQQAQDRARFQQAYASAQPPSPLQSALDDEDLNFINWEGGKGDYAGKPVDVTQAPGLGPALSLYERAKAGQQSERQGQGLLTMGENASDPNLAANLGEQRRLRREQDAAGALEGAVAEKSAEAHNSALPLINLSQSRALSLADLAGNQSRNSTGLYTQFRPAPSIWQQMLMGGVGAAGQVGAAYAGKP